MSSSADRWRLGRAGSIFVALAVSSPALGINVLSYNLLNYPGSSATQRNPLYQTTLSYLQPDIVIAQEVQGAPAAAVFKSNVLNVVNPGEWVEDTHFNCGDTDQCLFYRIASISTAGTGPDRAQAVATT